MIESSSMLPIKGQFLIRKFQLGNPDPVQVIGPFSNMITDIGLDRVASGDVRTHCYVGTGTVAPAFTDTSMSSFLVATSTVTSSDKISAAAPDWKFSASWTYRFSAGAISTNITEVGVGWGASPVNNLWSRELIVDSAGNPIALTVLPNEFLDVVYTLSAYVPQTDVTGSFTLNSIVYDYVIRAAEAGSWLMNANSSDRGIGITTCFTTNAALSASIGGTMTGTSIASPPVMSTVSAYVTGSHTKYGLSTFGLGSANHANGIQGFRLGRASGSTTAFIHPFYQMLLDKPIPKTNLNTMTITIGHSWARG